MEGVNNGAVSSIREIFKFKEKEIEDKICRKHEEMIKKIEKNPEYQKLQQKINELAKQKDKLEKERDKMTEHTGDSWAFQRKVLERLSKEFIDVRIEVLGKNIDEAKLTITEFAKKEFLEG